ncbi:hypothetical protein GCM10007385_14650 [Tateyamaria omphalii]|uniref:DUF3168 domain-containing protein n=1 Tax=Tateyamaria omphalii TaxID=299262 RepID=UPI00167B7F8E|nr:DUF3168 domain-containing protein [Tateyamaria omphalii]GGX47918.1 hypothetical protein GCM10007385_14650 [Tateyamaria omphalii]
MSYAISAALQSAVFTAIADDVAVGNAVGDAVYDALPSGALPNMYVSLGPETVRVADDKTGGGAVHSFVVSVVTEAPGFLAAKQVAGAVCDVLHDADLMLDRGRLVSLRFERARAVKIDKGTGRRIDLTFRARTEDNSSTII